VIAFTILKNDQINNINKNTINVIAIPSFKTNNFCETIANGKISRTGINDHTAITMVSEKNILPFETDENNFRTPEIINKNKNIIVDKININGSGFHIILNTIDCKLELGKRSFKIYCSAS
jgi:hypothetical protein